MATKRPRQAGSGRMAGSPPHTKCPSRKFQQEGNRNQSASANHPLLLAPRCALLVEFCLPLSQPTTAIYLSFLPVLLLSFLPQHHFFSTATVFDSSPLFQVRSFSAIPDFAAPRHKDHHPILFEAPYRPRFIRINCTGPDKVLRF